MAPAKRPVDALAELPSLGPTSAQMLVEAGIPDIGTLRALGPIGCYRSLRFHFGKRITVNFAYAIECAIRNLDWRLLEPERKAELKRAAQTVAAELDMESGRSRSHKPRPRNVS